MKDKERVFHGYASTSSRRMILKHMCCREERIQIKQKITMTSQKILIKQHSIKVNGIHNSRGI